MKMAAQATDRKSEIGKESHTPFSPSQSGSIYTRGTRNRSWRVSDRKMLVLTMPRLWKKLPETIPNPTDHTIIFISRSALSALAIISGSEVNNLTEGVVRSSETRKQMTLMRHIHFAVSQKTSLTRVYSLAP